MIGQTVKQYKILERIGAGGMGVVYKAEDTRLGRTVALKFLPPYALDSEEDRIRFINEAQSAASLDHPNICTIHEIVESEGHHFIVMAYVDGPSLKERMHESPIEPLEALEITSQIAAGLGKAHDKGIVHRDIKPANILMSKDGFAKVCDFGLAKSGISKKVTRTGSTIGTAAYMSPEQARSEPVDLRTDVWSLGVILYEMLAGKPPFMADHEAVVIYAILNDECPPLADRRPGLPSSVYKVVRKALAHRAAERYGSMEELRRELKTATEDLREQGDAPPMVAEAGTVPATYAQTEPDLVSGPSKSDKKPAYGLYAVIGGLTIAAVAFLMWFNFRPSVDAPTDSADGQNIVIAPPEAAGDAEQKTSLTVAEAKQTQPVVAVLYMENLSGDKSEDYFAAGLTEDLIVALSNIKQMNVRSRYDVMPLRGQKLSVDDMGKRLNADYLLEGAVRKDKKQLRLTAHLHRVADKELMWSLKYDRPTGDVFAVQAEIADSVARALAVAIAPAEKSVLAKALTSDPEAYDHYLRGRHAFERRSQEDNEQAEKSFRRAISADANFAAAYTGLARTLLQRPDWGWDDDPKLLTEAESLLDKAAPRDSLSIEHFYARSLLFSLRNDDQGALRVSRRAVQVFPNDPDAHYRLGIVLTGLAQLEEATRELRRSIELKPDHVHAYRWLGRVASWSGKPADATKHYRKSLELAPDAVTVMLDFGSFQLRRGEFTSADSLLRRAIALRPKTYDLKAVGGQSAVMQGRVDEAIKLLEEATAKAPDWNSFYFLGRAQQMAGKNSAADKSWKESLRLVNVQLGRFSDDPTLQFGQLYLRALLGEIKNPDPEFKKLAMNTKKSADPSIRFYYMAAIDAHLDNPDRALENLERTLKLNVRGAAFLAPDPSFEKLRTDPRFQKLVGKAPSS